MTWPTVAVGTTNTDADTDNPLSARPDLLDLEQKFNQVIAHVSAYIATLLDDADASAAQTTLGISTFIKTLLDDADAATARGTLGAAAAFPSGTALIFQQTSAPTGWTKSTTHNDKALRVVSGTVGSGGATAFTTVFGSGKTTGSHVLTTGELPASGLSIPSLGVSGDVLVANSGNNGSTTRAARADVGGTGATTNALSNGATVGGTTGNMGSGGGHDHTLSLDLQYMDVIVATKD